LDYGIGGLELEGVWGGGGGEVEEAVDLGERGQGGR